MQNRLPPDDPREWLNRARGSLARARMVVQGGYIEDACTDTHQAAEKALKAILLHLCGSFPRTHSLEALVELIGAEGVDVPTRVRRAGRLTVYATARYPWPQEPVTGEEHAELVAIAADVVSWAESVLLEHKQGTD